MDSKTFSTLYKNNSNNYIGKVITVQYQGLTKNGIPRFPVVVRFREDI